MLMSPLIDCDVHQNNPSQEQWVAYLPEPYRTEVARYGLRRLASGIRTEDGGMRWDMQETRNGYTLRDPQFYSQQLLDVYGHRYALLSGNNGPTAGIPDPDYADAICTAYNNFNLDHWLPADDRFLLSLRIPQQDPQLAVREIERLAGHPRIVTVSIFATANRIAFGERFYWPIYEACQKYNLPLHIHPSTTATIANAAMTPAGQATTYLESHVCMPQFYMAQVASMVLNGVFEKFDRLRVLLVEGGVCWLPHLLWRMDAEFKGLRQQAPFLKRLPSEYVFDHVRLTTQPIEEPPQAKHLIQMFDMINASDMLMYASDFPHWDFDEPTKLPRQLDDTARRKILHDNAAAWLNLPELPEPEASRS